MLLNELIEGIDLQWIWMAPIKKLQNQLGSMSLFNLVAMMRLKFMGNQNYATHNPQNKEASEVKGVLQQGIRKPHEIQLALHCVDKSSLG